MSGKTIKTKNPWVGASERVNLSRIGGLAAGVRIALECGGNFDTAGLCKVISEIEATADYMLAASPVTPTLGKE